jgi:autotransporter-associated beta strand protein
MMISRLGLGLNLAGLCLCALGCAAAAQAATKPNVVVIVADDASFNNFGFSSAVHGGTQIGETPNLDALASQSTVLKQGYVAASLCSVSRAGLLTGQYPQRLGFENNLANANHAGTLQNSGLKGLNDQQTTIAQRLKGLGYSTGAVGKWHLGYADNYNLPLDTGFDEFFGFWGGDRQYFQSCCDASSMRRGDVNVEAQWRTEGDHSKYDPVKGRYTTDAFGEEAVSFINNHAADANPFFLYVAFNTVHTPWDAKQSDLNHFASIADANDRMQAAMTYAMDREVGNIMSSLTNNAVDDNTIVMFMSDNGPISTMQKYSQPLTGWKGTNFEGGIRVPFLIKAPGVAPGIYDSPVTALDIAPTLYAAAGGDVSQIASDGYDVLPYLKGEATDDPNQVRFWRNFDSYAVRRGDWKLTLAYQGAPARWLFNVKQNPNENVYLQGVHPEIVADLARDLTNWEAQLEKPKWGDVGADDQNTFDHFVFRNKLAASTNWSAANAWQQGGTSNNKTMKPADAYANGVFEFTVRNDANYPATNDMRRMSRETFMLNQLRLTGDFNGGSNRQGAINGNALLFVKNLAGELPQIRLDATSNSTSASFAFQVNNELQLLHDLEITGNGTEQFVISGRIRDYYEPLQASVTESHNVRKTGSSVVTLTGNNTFAGTLTVANGKIVLDGPTSAIDGASSITVENGGSFSLNNGLVKTPALTVGPGGSFVVRGGRLETKTIIGDLVMNGGTFAPGLGTAVSTVSDDFVNTIGLLQLEIGGASPGTGYDQLLIGGTAAVGGGLQIMLVDSFVPSPYQTFGIITAGEVTGIFTNHSLPVLPGGLAWQVNYTTVGISLTVRPPDGTSAISPTGDYNHDGTVDASDYTVWRDSLGSTTRLSADGNGDQVVDQLDYSVWKLNMGRSVLSLPGDFNFDGSVDAADYTVWRDSLASNTDLAADGNGDRVVDQLDYAIWKTNLGQSFASLAGDFNRDGIVDAADYTVWRNGLGTRYTTNDYNVWKANFGAILGGAGVANGVGSGSSVPEPSAVLLLVLGAVFLIHADEVFWRARN